MKEFIASALYLIISLPVYLIVIIIYLYMFIFSSIIIYIMDKLKVEDLSDWTMSIDRLNSKIARCIFPNC